MFGKKFSEYLRFERWILILIAAAFIARLALSATGVSIQQARWVSINIVLLIGLIYLSIAVHTSGFGSYSQLFGLLLIQNAFAHLLVAGAITLAITTGTQNIYTAPEFFGGSDGRAWTHVLAHVLAAFLVPVVAWIIGSAVLFATRKLKPIPR